MIRRALVSMVVLAGCHHPAQPAAGVDAGLAVKAQALPAKGVSVSSLTVPAPSKTLEQQLQALDEARLPGPGPSPFTHLGSRPGVAWYQGQTGAKEYIAVVFAVQDELSVFTVPPPVDEVRVLGPDAVLIDDGASACVTLLHPAGYGERAAIEGGWCGPTHPRLADVDGDGRLEVLAPGPTLVERQDGGFMAFTGEAACARSHACLPDGGWRAAER